MMNQIKKEKERELKDIVTPYLKRGRPGDYEHTFRAVQYGKQLLQQEEGDIDIVIPTLYLHDIGWSQVNYDDFVNAETPNKKYDTESVDLHMKKGATLAKTILEELNYKTEIVQKITAIIAVHDKQKEIAALGDPSATIVFEADYLDKVGPESSERMRKMFSDALSEMDIEETKSFLERNIKKWFKTETARAMARAFLIGTSISSPH